jgi:hypothetical protein
MRYSEFKGRRPFMPGITPEMMVGHHVSEKVHLTKGTGERIIKLIESLSDTELEEAIKHLNLEKEFIKNFEGNSGKRNKTTTPAGSPCFSLPPAG